MVVKGRKGAGEVKGDRRWIPMEIRICARKNRCSGRGISSRSVTHSELPSPAARASRLPARVGRVINNPVTNVIII